MRILFAVLALLLSCAAPQVQADEMMDCMVKCIKYEGGNTDTNRSTCKMRCANVGTSQPQMRDCGKELRTCIGSCKRDTTCEAACRKASTTCM